MPINSEYSNRSEIVSCCILGFRPMFCVLLTSICPLSPPCRTLRATYHLGEDRAWQRKGGPHRSFALQNIKNAFHLEFWQKMCKFKVDTNANSPQTKNVIYQGNSKICTGIAYNFWCEGMDPCEVATCEYVARGSLTTKGKCLKNTLLTMRKKKSN